MTAAVLVKPDGTCGPTGLALIEELAGKGKTQATIAAALGISKKKFEKMLERGKGENPERLAWEAGHAVIEQRVSDTLLASGLGTLVEEDVLDDEGQPTGEKQMVRVRSKSGSIDMIWWTKNNLGWQDKPSNNVNVDNRINITLPAPMPDGELMKNLGITQFADYRKVKDVTPGAAAQGPEESKVASLPLPALPQPSKEPNGGT